MKAWQHVFVYTEGYYSAYEMHVLLSYSSYMQGLQLSVCDLSGSVSLSIADWEWPVQNISLNYSEIASDASLLQTQLASEVKTFFEKPLTEIQELKQVILKLQHRAEKLKKCFENLQNE